MEELEKIAVVNLLQRRSIISLIGNVQRSSLILEKVRIFLCSNRGNYMNYLLHHQHDDYQNCFILETLKNWISYRKKVPLFLLITLILTAGSNFDRYFMFFEPLE